MDAAVLKVQKTLGAIAGNLRPVIAAWEEKSDAASTALGRLQGVLERSAAVEAAGIPDTTPAAPAAAAEGSTDGSSARPTLKEKNGQKVQVQVQGGWGALSAIGGLPLALARVLANDKERWAKEVICELEALVRTVYAIYTNPHARPHARTHA